ncbi:hypothetical protein GCM10029978_081120 [Actinoallomurus acanthiterrae]
MAARVIEPARTGARAVSAFTFWCRLGEKRVPGTNLVRQVRPGRYRGRGSRHRGRAAPGYLCRRIVFGRLKGSRFLAGLDRAFLRRAGYRSV